MECTEFMKAMENDPHRPLLCSLCEEFSKSDLSIEKWIPAIIYNCNEQGRHLPLVCDSAL